MDLTAIVKRITGPQDSAYDELLPLLYEELRSMAARYLRKERADHTLQPTALVHEAYLKLVDQKQASYEDRRHFLAVAARAMRQILVDYARRQRAAKRGGDLRTIALDEGVAAAAPAEVDLLALNEALDGLEQLGERRCRVVELRFFGGFTNQEVAEALSVSPKTTEADWYVARAWLRRAMRGGTSA
jgi:RNA polymerase sigma factor (TIGR02999 family)